MALPAIQRMTDEATLVHLMKTHQATLWRYLRYLGCERDLADDLVQEVFLAVWRRPFEDRGPEATAAYLRRVTHNLFISECRRRRVRPVFRNLEAAEEVWCEYAREDEGLAYRAALRECIDALTERARRALSGFYGDGLSRTEIGRTLSMAPEGVKTILRRAREKLRSCITRKLT